MTGAEASQQYVRFSSNGEYLAETPILEDYKERSVTLTLPRLVAQNITVSICSQVERRWTDNSYLYIYGEYGNIVLATNTYESICEQFQTSFFYSIRKEDTWRLLFAQQVPEMTWTSRDYDDSSWKEYIYSNSNYTATGSGVQYYRKVFAGDTDHVACEIRLQYQYGIVVYINGVLIIIDNIYRTGNMTDSNALGGYTSLSYHGFVRNTDYFQEDRNVLSVELHMLNHSIEYTSTFDAWMALYYPNPRSECYAYGYETTAYVYNKDNDDVSTEYMWDLNHLTTWSTTASFVDMHIQPSIHTVINQVSVYSKLVSEENPESFCFYGFSGNMYYGNSSSEGAWSTLGYYDMIDYVANDYHHFPLVMNHQGYPYYYFQLSSISNYMEIHEMKLEVCRRKGNEEIDGIYYAQSSYRFYKDVDEVDIKPRVMVYHECYPMSLLPDGVNVNYDCSISGIPHSKGMFSVYIYGWYNGNVVSGGFTLRVSGCKGAVVGIERVFGSNEFRNEQVIVYEGWNENKTEVFRIDYNDPNAKSKTTYLTYHCFTKQYYQLYMASAYGIKWETTSYLHVFQSINDQRLYLLSCRYDSLSNYGHIHNFIINTPIAAHSEWFYYMNGIPDDLFDKKNSSLWKLGSDESFEQPKNQYQVFKKIVHIDSMNSMNRAAFYIRFRYGCYVYVNGIEVYRRHVSKEPQQQEFAENAFYNTMYVSFSNPIVYEKDGTVHDLFVSGDNVITIVLIALSAASIEVDFDGFVYFGFMNENRGFQKGIVMQPAQIDKRIVFGESDVYLERGSLLTNQITLSFPNHHEEWFNCFIILGDSRTNLYTISNGKAVYGTPSNPPTNITVYGKNEEDESPTLLGGATDIYWYYVNQHVLIWLTNNKHYNQYILSIDDKESRWSIGSIQPRQFRRDLYTLQYEELFLAVNHMIICVSPIYSVFFDYQATDLPEGIAIDKTSGCIHGIPTTPGEGVIHIKAFTVDNVLSSTAVVYHISECSEETSIYTTIFVYSGDSRAAYRYKIYDAIQNVLVYEMNAISSSYRLMARSLCLPYSIYRIDFDNTTASGSTYNGFEWDYPASFTVSCFNDTLVLLSRSVNLEEGTHSFRFSNSIMLSPSSYWRILTHYVDPPLQWYSTTYDDSDWKRVTVHDSVTEDIVTLYCRYSFDIPDFNRYIGIHLQFQFIGGIVVYFNGLKRAVYNLPVDYDANTLAKEYNIMYRTIYHYINYHIYEGKLKNNVIAVEIHRYTAHLSIYGIQFRAYGRFTEIDDALIGSSVDKVSITRIVDYSNPYDFIFSPQYYDWYSIRILTGNTLEWTLTNQIDEYFNAFAIETSGVEGISFILYGYKFTSPDGKDDGYPWQTLLYVHSTTLYKNVLSVYAMPRAMMGFTRFRLNFTSLVSNRLSIRIHQFSFLLIPNNMSSLAVCKDDSFYPGFDGQIVVRPCDGIAMGFIRDDCENGVLAGHTEYDECIDKLPLVFSYTFPEVIIVNHTTLVIQPEGEHRFANYIIEPELPSGLNIQQETGTIYGRVAELIEMPRTFTVYADNLMSAKSTTVTISSRYAHCERELDGSYVPLDTLDWFSCGKYSVGLVKKRCFIGDKDIDGRWIEIDSVCIPSYIVVAALFIVAVLLSLVFHSIVKVGGMLTRKKHRLPVQ